VDPDRVQEPVQLTDLVAVTLMAGELGMEVGEVALQQVPVDVAEGVDTCPVAEEREPGQGAKSTGERFPAPGRCPTATAPTS